MVDNKNQVDTVSAKEVGERPSWTSSVTMDHPLAIFCPVCLHMMKSFAFTQIEQNIFTHYCDALCETLVLPTSIQHYYEKTGRKKATELQKGASDELPINKTQDVSEKDTTGADIAPIPTAQQTNSSVDMFLKGGGCKSTPILIVVNISCSSSESVGKKLKIVNQIKLYFNRNRFGHTSSVYWKLGESSVCRT